MLFSCYRKDEASDPEIYSAAIAATLSDYSRLVVDRVTDPRTGVASYQKFLPAVAEVREACDKEQQKIWNIETYKERKAVPFVRTDTTSPGRRANLFVSAAAPQYEEMLAWVKTADEADWKNDPDGRPGVWVNWLGSLAQIVRSKTGKEI